MEFHVLLVEDDRVTLKTVEQLLRKCNYKVTCAANGREAIKVLSSCRQNGIKVDLILTDILMPEVTGFDLINEVVHGDAFCDVPVVVMSSQDSQENVLQAFQAGAADYLIKPIRKNELATLWQHVWRANKAKTFESGAGGHSGRDGDAIQAMKDGSSGGQIKDSSGGSSGAAISVLRSTGETTLPLHAGTVRQSALTPLGSGPRETSGDPLAEETVNGLPRQHARAHMHVRSGPPAPGPSPPAEGGTVHGVLGSGTDADRLPTQHVAGRTFASVAVHFDLNPAPSPGPSQLCAPEAHDDGATAVASGRPCDGDGADVNMGPVVVAGGTCATVISWSVGADLNERNELLADGAPKPKRPRLDGPAAAVPASRVAIAATAKPAPARPGSRLVNGGLANHAAGGASASGLAAAAAEGSQGSRAASGFAGREGTREGTATPSGGEGFAESPSTYTSATATATTTSTTGSGSEAAEEQRQQQHDEQEQEHPATRHGWYGREANGTATGPGAAVATVAVAACASNRTHGGHGAAVRCTATSAGPLAPEQPPSPTAAPAGCSDGGLGSAAGRGSAPPRQQPQHPQPQHQASDAAGARPPEGSEQHHRLPHPEAAAPPGSTAPGGTVTLPPGLQELAALGAQRHQELWTQRARLHQQQLQRRQQQQVVVEASTNDGASAAVQAKDGSSRQPAGTSAVGAGPRAAHEPAAAAGSDVLQAAGPPAGPPAPPEGARDGGAFGRTTPHPGQAAAQAESAVAATAGAAAVAAGESTSSARSSGGDVAGPSSRSGGLALLRHSERSAFTAFTVFLPGRVAAAAAAAATAAVGSTANNGAIAANATGTAAVTCAPPSHAPMPSQPPGVGGPPTALQLGAAAAGPSRPGPPPALPYPVAAAAAGGSHGGSAGGLLHPHPYTAQPHAHAGLPSPSMSVVLPPVVPLHTGHPSPAGARQPLSGGAGKPADPAAPPPVGTNGALGPAAAAAAAAAVAAHMPYTGMPPRPPAGLPFPPAPPHLAGPPPPPVFIPEPVLQLIAHLSGRAATEIQAPETVTQAPVLVQKAPSAARLAAVAKYLEKRKHRNFQKKVRYESRKRLAEARPRVRGQFVKASAATPNKTTPPPASSAAAASEAAAAAAAATATGRGAGGAVQGPTHRSGPMPMDLDPSDVGHDGEPDEEAAGGGEESDDSGAEAYRKEVVR